jgi:RHO1 GDP-GTP exchange protein 1/2
MDQLPDADQAWHRLVPKEAQDVLGKNEVKRQSILFEVFKSEKEYVTDLGLVREVRMYQLFSSTDVNDCIILLGVRQWTLERQSTDHKPGPPTIFHL